jgi:hypothetical protein
VVGLDAAVSALHGLGPGPAMKLGERHVLFTDGSGCAATALGGIVGAPDLLAATDLASRTMVRAIR